MSELIDRQALREKMYHEAFESDTDMQRWDSGCWIRYKMFENAVNDAPTIDAVEVVRCGECKHHEYEEPGMVYCPKIVGSWVSENWFCADGEREVQDGQ